MVVSNIFYFHPLLGKMPILTNIFQRGWNHQPDYFSQSLTARPIEKLPKPTRKAGSSSILSFFFCRGASLVKLQVCVCVYIYIFTKKVEQMDEQRWISIDQLLPFVTWSDSPKWRSLGKLLKKGHWTNPQKDLRARYSILYISTNGKSPYKSSDLPCGACFKKYVSHLDVAGS